MQMLESVFKLKFGLPVVAVLLEVLCVCVFVGLCFLFLLFFHKLMHI